MVGRRSFVSAKQHMKNKLLQKIGSRAIAASLALVGLASSLEAALQKIKVTIPVDYQVVDEVPLLPKVPMTSYQTRHFPFLYHDSQVTIVAFSHHADGKPRHPQDGIKISYDGGQTWPKYHRSTNLFPTDDLDELDDVADANTSTGDATIMDFNIAAMTRLPDGRLFLLNTMTLRKSVNGAYQSAVSASEAECTYWISSDNGESFTKGKGTVRMPKFPSESHPSGLMQLHQYQLSGDDPTTFDELRTSGGTFIQQLMPDLHGLLPECKGLADDAGGYTPCTCYRTPSGDANTWGAFLFHRSLFAEATGGPMPRLWATMYGRFDIDRKNPPPGGKHMARIIRVKSDNLGETWEYESTIAQDLDPNTYHTPGGHFGFAEPVVARCVDGSLLAVMRTSDQSPMYQCRLEVGAETWSLPVLLPGVAPEDAFSVDPDLTLMANGTLVLSFGRPNTRMLFSLDGRGDHWDYLSTIHLTPGASEYTGIREVSHNKLLFVTDQAHRIQCLQHWPTAVTGGNDELKYYHRRRIISKYIDVVPFEDFQLTAVNGLPAGYTKIDSTGTGSISGVIGSGGYSLAGWSGNRCLRIEDNSSSQLAGVIVPLDAETALPERKVFDCMIRPDAAPYGNMISLNKGGDTNDQTVFHLRIKSNGALAWYDASGWNTMTAPGLFGFGQWNKLRLVVCERNRLSVYVDDVFVGVAGAWHELGVVDRVRFSSGSSSGVGDRFHVDNISFQRGGAHDMQGSAIGSLPTGVTVLVGGSASVQPDGAVPGNQALCITDTSSVFRTNVLVTDPFNEAGSREKIIKFSLLPKAVGKTISISVNTDEGDDSGALAWLAIDADGKVRHVTGSQSVEIAPAGTVTHGVWNELRLQVLGGWRNSKGIVTPGFANLFVGEVFKGRASLSADDSRPVVQVRFMSGSKSGTGDEYYVDNLLIEDRPTAVTPPSDTRHCDLENNVHCAIKAPGHCTHTQPQQ